MDKKCIIAIVGASGSGKTSLSLEAKKWGYPVICSYTTRPKREGEIDGVDHYFVTDDHVPTKDEMLAYTVFGGYQYWAEKSQLSDTLPTLYVIDEKGLFELKEKYKDVYNIFTVYVTRPNNDVDQSRKDRDRDRITLSADDIDLKIVNNYPDVKSFLDNETLKLVRILDDLYL